MGCSFAFRRPFFSGVRQSLWIRSAISLRIPWEEFVQSHRADAVHTLDVAHAALDMRELAQHCEQAGVTLPTNGRIEPWKELKEHGPAEVLKEVRRIRKKVADRCKREEQMPSAQVLDHGWPLGSGMAESGNTHVVQTRLKGADMHGKREQVNAMLALRTTMCSDRWAEDWPVVRASGQAKRRERFRARSQAALAKARQRLQQTFWRLPWPFLLACFPPPPPTPSDPGQRGRRGEGWSRWVPILWGNPSCRCRAEAGCSACRRTPGQASGGSDHRRDDMACQDARALFACAQTS